MEVWLVAITALCLVGLGFWIMHRIDRFACSGGIHPYWDEAEERSAQDAQPPAPPAVSLQEQQNIAC